MNNLIVSETSSCQTASNVEPCAFRQIVLDVYYTSIYKDPMLLNAEHNVIKKQFTLFDDCYVLAQKEGSKVKITKRKKQVAKLLLDGYEVITQIKFQLKENGQYSFSLERNLASSNGQKSLQKALTQSTSKNINSLVFLSIKHQRESSRDQEIKENGFVKFGKEIYEAKIYPYSFNTQSVKLNQLNPAKSQTMQFQLKNNSGECKICLMNEGQSPKDYVVSPCKCSGSCSAVHVQCLKSWITQKIQVGKGDRKIHTYDMSRFTCQICKEKYPEILQVENSTIDITPQMKIKSDTLVLTKLYPSEQDKKYSHFVNLQKGKTLSIGRHYCNELILDDMSISRNHAEIYRCGSDKKFYIQDKSSRFGTFIDLNDQVDNLKEATLLNSKLTFRFKLVEENPHKCSVSSVVDDQITEEKIEF